MKAWAFAVAATLAGVLLVAAFVWLSGLTRPAVHQVAPPSGYQIVGTPS